MSKWHKSPPIAKTLLQMQALSIRIQRDEALKQLERAKTVALAFLEEKKPNE